jgi:hypothetical protein
MYTYVHFKCTYWYVCICTYVYVHAYMYMYTIALLGFAAYNVAKSGI